LAAPWLKWIVNAPAVKAQLVADLKLRETYEVPRSAVVASARARVATRPGEASSSLSTMVLFSNFMTCNSEDSAPCSAPD